jgi:hypothetical protein
VQIVPDNYLYARVALVVKDKGSLSEEKLPQLTEVLADEAKAQQVRRHPACCCCCLLLQLPQWLVVGHGRTPCRQNK